MPFITSRHPLKSRRRSRRTALAACAVLLSLGLAACGGGGGGGAETGGGPSGAGGSTTADGPGASGTPLAPIGPQMVQLAGSPYRNGNTNGTGDIARFGNTVSGAVFDAAGNLLVADGSNHVIRKIGTDGIVSDYAGKSASSGSANGSLDNARFQVPAGMARDAAGNIYIAERSNHSVRKITPEGVVSLVAGGSSCAATDGVAGAARFCAPQGIAVDAAGTLYVADTSNYTIRKIVPDGTVTTIAGTAGMSGKDDGMGAAARFNYPVGIAVSAAGDIYVADQGNAVIRRIQADGTVTTFAGTAGSTGGTDGIGAAARFYGPTGLAIDGAGRLVVTEAYGRRVRRIDLATAAVETLAGSGSTGDADGTGTAASFSSPVGVAVAANGDLAITEEDGRVRRVTPAGVVTTIAGRWTGPGKVDAAGTNARFNTPQHLAQDAAGNVFVADMYNNMIRRVSLDGVVTSFSGTGSSGVKDGSATVAQFGALVGIAMDGTGNLFVADPSTHTIRRVAPNGTASTLAGTAYTPGNADGTGAAATFRAPTALVVGKDGNVYVADRSNHCVRRITQAGVTSAFAGTCGTGTYGNGNSANDDGMGTAARFSFPSGMAVDADGNLYVSEQGFHRIRKITPAGQVSTVAGATNNSGGYVDGPVANAKFNQVTQMTLDDQSNLYVVDSRNHVIRKITPDGMVSTVAGRAGEPGDTNGLSVSPLQGRLNNPVGISWHAGKLTVSTGNGLVRIDLAL
jgi:sugar lactone lactonase YvrE